MASPEPRATTDAADDPVGRAAVEAVLGGDRDAFRILVEREAPGVIRACHRILGDPHEAEDIAQEAFVTAYRSLSTWRADGPFGAWLTRIAVRLALRQAGRRRPVAWIDPLADTPRAGSPTGGMGAAADGPAARVLVTSASHDPATLVERGEREAEIRAAVAALDEPYREVVALRFFGELSLVEIAIASDRPIGTVKTHLHRGLLRLRTVLASAGDER